MVRRNKVTAALALTFSCVLFLFITGCGKRGISEDEVYPKGNIIKTRVFDTSNNEKIVSLSDEDTKFILKILRNSKKELVHNGYESGLVELNIVFTDSTIQLVRKDDEAVYYVFHNNKIDAICYKIKSKDLSQFISKLAVGSL